MIHRQYTEVKAEKLELKDAKDLSVRWLITKEDGAENFAMRLFELAPDGYTPWHQHDYEHEVFVLEGNGTVLTEERKELALKPGDVIFIPAMEWHQFKNKGSTVFKFLCLIPYKK